MLTRFGSNRDSRLSHTIIVVFALINCLGFLAYGFVGLGKFMMIFIPWDLVSPYVPFEISEGYIPHFYGIVFTMFAVFYAVLGGMTSIVWADVLQYVIMTVSALVIGIIAMNALAGSTLQVPDGWKSPFFGWRLNDLDWGGSLMKSIPKLQPIDIHCLPFFSG
jgi:Na+(H+)/acetate symporter ActP